MGNAIQVLVVDDSAFMRKVISDMLNKYPGIKVMATARNGQDALRKRKELRPDVITLDVEMPIMDGLETLKQLMDDDPCPVVMVSSTTKEGAKNTLFRQKLAIFCRCYLFLPYIKSSYPSNGLTSL